MTGRRAAVLGSPIAHSKSPALHRAAYRSLGLDWSYDAIRVEPGQLSSFLAGLEDSWAGLSLTMPLKQEVVGLLDESSDEVRATGAANTVVLTWDEGSPRPRLAGFNTDVAGIVAAFGQAGVDHIERGAVFGAGATAASAIRALMRMGATHIDVAARRDVAIRELIDAASSKDGPAGGVEFAPMSWPPPAEVLASDAVVSTVPAGAADLVRDVVAGAGGSGSRRGESAGSAGAGARQPESGVGSAPALLDVVYDPWPTVLAQVWPGPVVPGLSMLLWQAAEQVELFTGQRPNVTEMARAVGLKVPENAHLD